jgi:hypothetical protein
VYSPNRNPTELYYKRDALLRQEACNKRLGRPLATLSTMLVVIVLFVGLASIVVGPGRAIDYVGTHLLPVVGMLGVLVVAALIGASLSTSALFLALARRRPVGERVAEGVSANRLPVTRPIGPLKSQRSSAAWGTRQVRAVHHVHHRYTTEGV